jgi:hypothetical protein
VTSNLLTTIQSIAVNAVQSTNPMQYCYGTVTNADPLKIRLNDTTLEITGNSILLTESVVEKKITIQKHTHKIGSTIADHTHIVSEPPLSVSGSSVSGGEVTGAATGTVPKTKDFDQDTEIVTTVLEAVCTEFGKNLPVDRDDKRIVITTNRALEKDDKVLMLRVSAGQRFIVLSRVFTRSDETD